MINEKLIIDELVKVVKENRIEMEDVPFVYKEEVKLKTEEVS